MEIYPAAKALEDERLNAPTLNALVHDVSNYTVLLLQPQGVIEATNDGIRSRDRELARAQFGTFLEQAAASQPDLAVTPEYSMPWDVLKDVIRDPNAWPADGKIWAFGCESIRYRELQALKAEVANVATVIFEEMQGDDTKFVDPLAYVFRTHSLQGGDSAKLAILVQFKTHPMADLHDFEKNRLQTGRRVYRFNNPESEISLLTFICSDFFAFTDAEARAVYDRALILHIQLNPKRQHTNLRSFRGRLFQYSGDETELITLNWARGSSIDLDGQGAPAAKFAGSAWYLKADKIDLSDSLVASNHRRGLYYTRMSSLKTHAMFFNFAPAIYELTASKVVHIGVPGPVGTRRGPVLDTSRTWDEPQSRWTNAQPLIDGFEDILSQSGGAKAQVKATYDACPCACERLLAISAGDGCKREDWHRPAVLDSFTLDEAEHIFRMTFCQPSHEDEESFRQRRLRKCARLWQTLQDAGNLPPALKDISDGYTLEWTPDARHQNLRSHVGSRGRATVMHLGDSKQEACLAAYKRALKCVHASELDEDLCHAAKQRVAAWYFNAQGALQRVDTLPRIDDQFGESPVDIGRRA